MKMERTRVPSQVIFLIFWCGCFGVIFLTAGLLQAEPWIRASFVVVGLLYAIPVIGLWRLRPWGRLYAVALFIILLVKNGVLFSKSGISGLPIGESIVGAWALFYLLSASTARLFGDPAGAKVDLVQAGKAVAGIVLLVAAIFGLRHFGTPKWVAVAVPVTLYVVGEMLVGAKVNRWVGAAFSPRPSELDDAQAAAFAAARRALAGGDTARADSLAAPLPDCRGVTILRGLIAMHDGRDDLGRLVFDAGHAPPASAREAVAETCRRGAAEPLADRRVAFVDALLDDAAQDHPMFSHEFVNVMERLTGKVYMANDEAQFRDWWTAARPLCAGARAARWLTVRLWDARCTDAATAVADRSGVIPLSEAARVAAAIDALGAGPVTPEWFATHFRSVTLLPLVGEAGGLYHVDAPIPEQAVHVRLRLPLVEFLRTIRDEYPEAPSPNALLCALTAVKEVKPRSRRKFEAWWARERPAQQRFDLSLACGLEAAARGDWAEAEGRFAEAERAAPDRTSALYNRGFALAQQDRFEAAEAAFAEGARRRPDDAAWWTRAGDCRVKLGRPAEALDAYRAAIRVGDMEEELAIKLGLTYAMTGNEAAAARTLDEALTGKTDPQTLTELSAFLEAHGQYRLARKYGEQAFRRSLSEEPPDDDEDDEPLDQPTV